MLIQVYVLTTARCSENLLFFPICDIYINFQNLGDGEKVNDCLYISHFLFIISETFQEYNAY